MSEKIEKISVNAFERQVKANRPNNISTFMWGDVEVSVKRRLSFADVLEFVDDVVKTCFTQKGLTYLPEVKNFAIKSDVLTMYANFTMPSNVEYQYELIYDSGIVSEVIKYIDREQFDEILAAIDDKIDAEIQIGASMLRAQASKLITSISDLEGRFSDIFSGIGEKEMADMISAITDGKFDADKLISAYFDKKKRAENIEVTTSDGNN